MGPLVRLQGSQDSERFFTMRAAKQLLPCVDPLVCLHVSQLCERFFTLKAAKGFFFSLTFVVSIIVRRELQSCVALFAEVFHL